MDALIDKREAAFFQVFLQARDLPRHNPSISKQNWGASVHIPAFLWPWIDLGAGSGRLFPYAAAA
jgi:hypothetical protein